MEWHEVESSNISAIGYDKETSELHVRFMGGAEYVYQDVQGSVHQDFLAAPSKGKYLADHIKGVYAYEKIK